MNGHVKVGILRMQVPRKIKFVVLPFILMSLMSGGAVARLNLGQIETEHSRLIFFRGAPAFLSPHVGRCFENAYRYHTKFWDYSPSEKVTVLMFDDTDYGNAGASATPQNTIIFKIAPTSPAYETSPVNERVNTMMNHEMVHIVALDKSAGADNTFRTLFSGKVRATAEQPLSILYNYLTTPRRSSPRWYHEGIAVFMETWMAGGMGRAMGSFDEMVFRTLVLDSGRFYDPVGVESEGVHVDFQVGVNSYLYGTRFISYLALQYGPESVVRWVSRADGSRRYYSSQFKRVFGKSLDEGWREWVAWEHEFQRHNLELIRQYPTTRMRDIAHEGLGSMSCAQYDPSSGNMYVAVNYPGQVAHIAAINTQDGSIKRVCDVKGAAIYFVSSLALDTTTGSLFYTADNNDWRDLRVVNIKTGSSHTLLKDLRGGDLALNPADKSLWCVRHFNGLSTIARLAPPYDDWNQVLTLPYGQDMFELNISPDGKTLAAGRSEVNGRQTLVAMDIGKLMMGDTSSVTLFDFRLSIPATFVFSRDGRYLYGSSYYTGASNIFRYDFTLDSMETLSNAESGLFRPLPVEKDSLIVFRYTSSGFVPAKIAIRPLEDVNAIDFLGQRIVEEHPVVKDWIAPGPGTINLDSMSIDTGRYVALANLGITSAYPIVEGYKDFPAYGIRLNLADPVGIHSSKTTVSYTPNRLVPENERAHVSWEYEYANWRVALKYNDADFYDLFGPTKTSRKGQSFGVSYHKSLLSDGPKSLSYAFGVTGYRNLERLPDYQNVATTFDKFLSGRVSLSYSNRQYSLGAVDYEKGIKWNLSSNGRLVNRQLYAHLRNGLDFGAALPWNHSAIWLRTSAGYAYGPRNNPFANFFFGGFGNNWVDHRYEKRYRAYYAFPGVELNELAGKNYAKALVEWALPPLRFRRLGAGSLYLTWARLALFGSGIATNVDRDDLRLFHTNVGAQLDIRITFLSYLKTTMSLGYARAFERRSRASDELMFSVKLL